MRERLLEHLEHFRFPHLTPATAWATESRHPSRSVSVGEGRAGADSRVAQRQEHGGLRWLM
jgi:hypothetical protein